MISLQGFKKLITEVSSDEIDRSKMGVSLQQNMHSHTLTEGYNAALFAFLTILKRNFKPYDVAAS